MVKKGSHDMAENSEVSAKSGKSRTKQTVKLTQGEALEILQESVRVYQQAGGKIILVPVKLGDVASTGIMLIGVDQINGNLVAINGSFNGNINGTMER